MTTFGTRLREERTRIGMTQPELGTIGGVNTNTQGRYEKDKQSPTVDYLLKIGAVGIDAMYLLYGARSAVGASQRVTELLEVITQLAPEQQAMSFAMMMLFRRSGEGQAKIENAEAFWRAAQLFELFLGLPTQYRNLLESAATDLQATAGK